MKIRRVLRRRSGGPGLRLRARIRSPRLTRRGLLIAVPSAVVIAVGADRLSRKAEQPLVVRGADVSFLLQEERVGHSYSHHGRTRRVEQILADAGATHVRLRVWVAPPPGYSDANDALELAQRARDVGLNVVLDLHYADFWADHTNQPTPAAWAGQPIDQLADTVHDYTAGLLTRFSDNGAAVDIVQIGNEITNGMLWPNGYLDGSDESWGRLAKLVSAGIAGAGSSRVHGPRPRTALHISTGGDRARSETFFDSLDAAGVTDFDVIALSYYPFWNGPLSDLAGTLGGLAGRFDKDLLVAETAYPWTLPEGSVADEQSASGGQAGADLVRTLGQLPEHGRHPPTRAGQSSYFEALRAVLVAVPGGRGLGFLDWEPEWLPGVGATPGEPSDPYRNLTMFDHTGQALPSVDVAFRRPD